MYNRKNFKLPRGDQNRLKTGKKGKWRGRTCSWLSKTWLQYNDQNHILVNTVVKNQEMKTANEDTCDQYFLNNRCKHRWMYTCTYLTMTGFSLPATKPNPKCGCRVSSTSRGCGGSSVQSVRGSSYVVVLLTWLKNHNAFRVQNKITYL